MVVMMDYSLAPSGKTLLEMPQIGDALKEGMLDGPADSPTFRDAPIFLKEELTFPYRYGMDFTLALEKAGGKELAFAGRLQRSADNHARDHGTGDLYWRMRSSSR